jgi:uncharacterized protein
LKVLPPRFACDVMLGKTAKWLRLLGVDTFYDNRAADADLKIKCLSEGRILLTKDVALHAAMPAGSSRLVETVGARGQLLEIVAAFHLEHAALPPRCPLCNGGLAAIEKELVEGLVPPYVFRTQERFQRCCRCRKIYWPGTHLGRINTFIETIKKASG